MKELMMGWNFELGGYTKQAVIERILADPGTRHRFVKHSLIGRHLWMLIQNKETGQKSIGLALIGGDNKGGWGYKLVAETSGPNQYDCPLSFLKLASPTANEIAIEWRKECLNWHKQKRDRPRPAVGQRVLFQNKTYRLIQPMSSGRSWIVHDEAGRSWKMSLQQIKKGDLLPAN